MSESRSEVRASLVRQRRFLIVMSLALSAFYLLGVGAKGEGEYSGITFTVGEPERVATGLWLIWGWALWRYGQRVYELLSVLWREVVEDVYAEDRRMALVRARSVANKLAADGQFDESLPKSARVDAAVTIEPPRTEELIPHLDGDEITRFQDYLLTRDGSRVYPSLKAIFVWQEHGITRRRDIRFKMSLTRWRLKWFRFRAWLHSVLRLPAFGEHIAPLLLAAATVVIGLLHRS